MTVRRGDLLAAFALGWTGGLMLLACALGAMSVGLFFVPAAILLLVASTQPSTDS